MSNFTTPPTLRGSNIYEVNVRQYTTEGTFKAFIAHLPRLQQMGVEILWFMPVFPIGLLNRKGSLGSYYSIKDFCAVNPEFGTQEDFKALVKEIHRLGMKIILDWVANHAAWDNVWTVEHPEYFVQKPDGDFLSPYDWTDVIQINHDNKDQQQAMIHSMAYWIKEAGIDGFRADLAHLTPLPFWLEARAFLDAIKPGLIWLAESEEPAYAQAFDLTYTWKWMHATEQYARKEMDIAGLKNILMAKDGLENCLRMYFTSNHDENSWNGSEYEKYGVFAKALAVFSCTYQNAVPLVYSGQEIPNARRLAFFEKDSLEWRVAELDDFYRTLFAFRRTSAFYNQSVQSEFRFIDTPGEVLGYEAMAGDQKMVVLLNLSGEEINCACPEQLYGKFRNLFSGMEEYTINRQIYLAAGAYLVYLKI